jgi:hypothetical protein
MNRFTYGAEKNAVASCRQSRGAGTMTIDELVARFEQRSCALIVQAHLFLFGVLILLLAGALAVVYLKISRRATLAAPLLTRSLLRYTKSRTKSTLA